MNNDSLPFRLGGNGSPATAFSHAGNTIHNLPFRPGTAQNPLQLDDDDELVVIHHNGSLGATSGRTIDFLSAFGNFAGISDIFQRDQTAAAVAADYSITVEDCQTLLSKPRELIINVRKLFELHGTISQRNVARNTCVDPSFTIADFLNHQSPTLRELFAVCLDVILIPPPVATPASVLREEQRNSQLTSAAASYQARLCFTLQAQENTSAIAEDPVPAEYPPPAAMPKHGFAIFEDETATEADIPERRTSFTNDELKSFRAEWRHSYLRSSIIGLMNMIRRPSHVRFMKDLDQWGTWLLATEAILSNFKCLVIWQNQAIIIYRPDGVRRRNEKIAKAGNGEAELNFPAMFDLYTESLNRIKKILERQGKQNLACYKKPWYFGPEFERTEVTPVQGEAYIRIRMLPKPVLQIYREVWEEGAKGTDLDGWAGGGDPDRLFPFTIEGAEALLSKTIFETQDGSDTENTDVGRAETLEGYEAQYNAVDEDDMEYGLAAADDDYDEEKSYKRRRKTARFDNTILDMKLDLDSGESEYQPTIAETAVDTVMTMDDFENGTEYGSAWQEQREQDDVESMNFDHTITQETFAANSHMGQDAAATNNDVDNQAASNLHPSPSQILGKRCRSDSNSSVIAAAASAYNPGAAPALSKEQMEQIYRERDLRQKTHLLEIEQQKAETWFYGHMEAFNMERHSATVKFDVDQDGRFQ